MKVTADTITDGQIRELRERLFDERQQLDGEAWRENREQALFCDRALGFRASPEKGGKAKARARCAEILNARNVKTQGLEKS